MKLLITPLLFLLCSLHAQVHAQVLEDIVTVNRVDFNSLRDDWIQVAIDLTCGENPSPEARNKSFVENIGIKVYLAYLPRGAQPPNFDFYTAEVTISIMEYRDKRNVYFYLPGPIAKRDMIRRPSPEFFYVEVTIDGKPQKPQTKAMSGNIPNLDILNSFISQAESGSGATKDLLMPIYLVEGADLGRVTNLPVFLRREAK